MLTGGPGADSTRGDAERSDAPVVISERRANKAPEGEANISVGGEEASRLCTRRHGSAGVQDLSPPRTGPEKAKGALSVGEASDGIEEGTRLGDAAAKEGFTPVRGSDGRPEELEGSRPIPSAAGGSYLVTKDCEVVQVGMTSVLLRLTTRADTIKTEGQGGQEGANRWSGACANTVVEVKCTNVEPRWKGPLSVPRTLLSLSFHFLPTSQEMADPRSRSLRARGRVAKHRHLSFPAPPSST